jgi:hypothetical protein
MNRYYLFARDVATNGQGAHFLVNPAARRNVVLEAPHAPSDPGTASGAGRMFLSALAPRAAIFSGAIRCALDLSVAPAECAGETPTCPGDGFPRSDMAHVTHSLFHVLHARLDARTPEGAARTRFAQLHYATSEPVLATGTSDGAQANAISTTLRALVAARVAPDVAVHSCNDGDDGTTGDSIIGVATNNECADFNAQALYTNAGGSLACGAQNPRQGSDRFVQIEGDVEWSSLDLTADGTARSVGWFQVMDALSDPRAWGACDLACAGDCGLGPAHPRTMPRAR